MIELDYKFEGCLPEMMVDECRIPCNNQQRKFRDCLKAGESVKALSFDVKAQLSISQLTIRSTCP